MSRYKKDKGKMGEDFVVGYLKRQKHTIVDRNVYLLYGEIDIVSKKTGVYIFTEVKTRLNDSFIPLVDSISYKQQSRLIHNCELYLTINKLEKISYRIDLAALIVKYNKIKKFRYFEGIL